MFIFLKNTSHKINTQMEIFKNRQPRLPNSFSLHWQRFLMALEKVTRLGLGSTGTPALGPRLQQDPQQTRIQTQLQISGTHPMLKDQFDSSFPKPAVGNNTIGKPSQKNIQGMVKKNKTICTELLLPVLFTTLEKLERTKCSHNKSMIIL